MRAIATSAVREPGMLQREIEAYLTARRRKEAMESGLEKLRAAAEISREPESAARP